MKAFVLVDENWGIGKDGDQIVYIPCDLKFFREMTMGHPIIMGRKTFETFPRKRPLDGRKNLVLSRNPAFHPEGATVFSSMEKLLSVAPEDAFVIGGASVYDALLDCCDTAYITKVYKRFPVDCWFPNLDCMQEWYVAEEGPLQEENDIPFCHLIYKKIEN